MAKNERIEGIEAIEGQNPFVRWEKLYALVEGETQTFQTGNLGGFKVRLIDPSIFNLADPSLLDQLSAIHTLHIIGGRFINDAGVTKHHFRADLVDRLRDQKKFVIVNDKDENANEEVTINADDIETFEPFLHEMPKEHTDEMTMGEEFSSKESAATGNSSKKRSVELPLFQRIKRFAEGMVTSLDRMVKDFAGSIEKRAEEHKKAAKREREKNRRDDIKADTLKEEAAQRAHNIEAKSEVDIDMAIKKDKTPPPRKKN